MWQDFSSNMLVHSGPVGIHFLDTYHRKGEREYTSWVVKVTLFDLMNSWFIMIVKFKDFLQKYLE